MVKIELGDILDIDHGIILHQVNCQNAIGAGISGAIINKYPIVAEKYHELCEEGVKLGQLQYVGTGTGVGFVNCFSQYNYGNSAKTGIKYTNEDLLIDGIIYTCEYFAVSDWPVYVPWKVGCGLAGGDWSTVLSGIIDKSEHIDNLTIVRYCSSD